ncbi:MAG: metal ABC transporter ATP-binding protein [Oscillospiraceae bacterium]|nr:metal ABC transporter ATP-binding protein [Oscillospiraceae bacterium]
MALITCRDAAFAYEGRVVVTGLNFDVQQGNYLCIVGENGSGKTTLMKGLLGLMQPKSGKIETGDGLKSTQIGYLPQQTSAQKDFPASVYEVVISGRLGSRGILPFYSKLDKQIALENMEKLGILPLRKKSFRELSGGQQQRVLLSRALCATEKVLLLDEPVSGLDPIVTAEFYSTIRALSRDTGITIIMISHDIRAAVEYASHILHLQNRQIFFGTTEDYVQSEAGQYFLKGGDHYASDH